MSTCNDFRGEQLKSTYCLTGVTLQDFQEILRGLGTQTEHAKHEHEEAGADESPTKFSKFTNFFKRRKSSIKETYGATEDTKRFYSDDTGLVGSEDEEQRVRTHSFSRTLSCR